MNGLPAWCVHAPSIFFMTWPVLGMAAFIYAGLTLAAALGRTALIAGVAKIILPSAPTHKIEPPEKTPSFKQAFIAAWLRFRKRAPGLLGITIPCYLLIFFIQKAGFFAFIENWLTAHANWLTFLNPQTLSILILQMTAEMGAALGAAQASLTTGAVSARDIIIALLCGSALAAPLRALRHQLPAYMAWFSPGIALKLVILHQLLRVGSICLMLLVYINFQ